MTGRRLLLHLRDAREVVGSQSRSTRHRRGGGPRAGLLRRSSPPGVRLGRCEASAGLAARAPQIAGQERDGGAVGDNAGVDAVDSSARRASLPSRSTTRANVGVRTDALDIAAGAGDALCMDEISFNADHDGTVRVYLRGDTRGFLDDARAAGLQVDERMELALGEGVAWVLSGFVALGGLSGIAKVIEAYTDRNNGKVVRFKTRSGEVTVEGTSAGEAGRLIGDLLEQEGARERAAADRLGIRAAPDDVDGDAPGSA